MEDTKLETENEEHRKTEEEDRPDNMNAQYAPLLQNTPSDEEEDDVLSFGRADEFHTRAPEKPSDGIPMHSLGPPRPGHLRDNGYSNVITTNRKNSRKYLVVVFVVGCALVIVGFVAAAFAILGQEYNRGIVHNAQVVSREDWILFMNGSATESGVTLADVDGDGLDDILVAIISLDQDAKIREFQNGLAMKEACSMIGFAYPCLGQMVALRGYDHKQLWRTWSRSGIIFSNCGNIDVNGDEKLDCIFTGRASTVQAVDLETGHTHWVIDADEKTWGGHFVPEWNVYRALSLPDQDGDGVEDLMVTHGGNQSKEPEDHDRASGRVIFLSGATGKPLGRYLELPRNRETYMSPVRHVTANRSIYYLFGSGGETVSGDLTIAMQEDLQKYIMGNGPYPLRSLFSGREKGVMVPPVMADVTQDGTPDLLMSAFEGYLVLYDGETLKELWRKHFPGMESYCTPAPGHYDDDGVLDFMVWWGHGTWMIYDYITVFVISGRDAKVLYSRLTSPWMVHMYSDLSLRGNGTRDLFLFFTSSGPVTPSGDGLGMLHGADARRRRRHGGHREGPVLLDDSLESFKRMCEEGHHEYEESSLACSGDYDDMRGEMMLLDKVNGESPPVYSLPPQPHHYTLPVNKNGRHCHRLSPIDRTSVDMCVVMVPTHVTAAVGDVDGDTVPDLIRLDNMVAQVIDDGYSYMSTNNDVVLGKLSLGDALKGRKKTLELLPMIEQPWRQFMGSAGDNVYRTTTLKMAS